MHRIQEKFRMNITNFMFWISSVFLVIVMAGMIMSFHVSKQTEYHNYLFSDASDIVRFAEVLEENEIPCRVVSDTVIAVSPKWAAESEKLYQEYFS
ncbi:MAG: hypothetical protein Q4C61_10265 [Lachnospiraceae bacterium]|nr:hypothetical protein [Lachnospiraceae bacterium]